MQRLGLPADDDTVMDPNQAAIALAMAMNQARMELADREGVKSEARTFGAARLETLRKKLAPLYAAIPRDVEMFDLHRDEPGPDGLSLPAGNPRRPRDAG
jgi:hypothetical protein